MSDDAATMMRFYAKPFMATMGDLGRAIAALEDENPMATIKVLGVMGSLERNLKELPLSRATLTLFGLLRETIDEGREPPEAVRTRLYDFETVLHSDLDAHLYLIVVEGRREFFEQSAPPFGPEVQAAFPSAGPDIAQAARCIALDMWTACVFHLMRVVEVGLHHMAHELKISMTATLEIENWKNIIDQLESEIRKLEATPRGKERAARLQFYSEAAAQFRWIKDAWRNDVAHARQTYGEQMTLAIWTATRSFMCQLAKQHAQTS